MLPVKWSIKALWNLTARLMCKSTSSPLTSALKLSSYREKSMRWRWQRRPILRKESWDAWSKRSQVYQFLTMQCTNWRDLSPLAARIRKSELNLQAVLLDNWTKIWNRLVLEEPSRRIEVAFSSTKGEPIPILVGGMSYTMPLSVPDAPRC